MSCAIRIRFCDAVKKFLEPLKLPVWPLNLVKALMFVTFCMSIFTFFQEISRIRGPFSFVYYRPRSKKIWFGRDFFGRHSLLIETGSKQVNLECVILENIQLAFVLRGCADSDFRVSFAVCSKMPARK